MRGRIVVALFLMLCLFAGRSGADTQFLLLSGSDTVSVERFTSGPTQLQGRLDVKAMALRMEYVMVIGSPGTPAANLPARLAMTVRRASAPDSAPPMQNVVFTFGDDSVRIATGPGKKTTMPCARGAWPYANPSMAMLARALDGVRPAMGDTVIVQLLLASGGRVMPATVRMRAPDTLSVTLDGVEVQLSLDAHGKVNGGLIPQQGLRIESSVVMSGEAFRGPAKPDYSAPAHAPYTAEEVRVPVGTAYHLAGTLTMPKGAKGDVPCVVTITGSGLEDRDESLPIVPGYRPFRQFADALARRGIATLRLDDRGFGASEGDPTQATSADFADDVRAALAWLRTRPGIDHRHLALLGHSEGGLIAPMVAADDPGVCALVLLAGPSRTGRRVIEYQQRQAVAHLPGLDDAGREARARQGMAETDSSALHNPWLKFFLAYDPLTAARRVRVPVLVMQGANDRQVEAVQAAELDAALREGGDQDVTVKVLPNKDHLFLEDAAGDPDGYMKLKEREIRPDVLKLVTDWLATRVR